MRKQNRMTTVVWTALSVAMIAPVSLAAQAGRVPVEEGNRLYAEGQYQEAYQKYLEALLEAPDSPLIRFNEGNALFQGQDLERAMEAYQAAIESGDPALQSAAWYNLGNSLFQGQQLEEALDAYKQALRVNPGDQDAKHNLERVLEQMQQDQQDPQDQQNQDPNQDEQDPDDEQNQDQQQPQNPDGGDPEQDEPDEGQQPPPEQDPGEDEQDPNQSPNDPGEDEQEQDGEGQPEPREGQMSPEEAERLLQAVQEDPNEVNRKGTPARGRRPRKKW